MSTAPSAPPETPNVATTSSADTGTEGDAQDAHQRNFECNICLDTATDAVISMCGHLFCWGCLYQWMNTQRLQCLCPVCKAPISKERVIPLYGRGSSSQRDPRNTTPTPPRPQGRRSSGSGGAGDANGAAGGFFGGGGMDDGGIRMSLGIGAFPFSMFTASFNVPGFSGAASDRASPGDAQRAQQIEGAEFVSNVFLCIALVCIVWLLFI